MYIFRYTLVETCAAVGGGISVIGCGYWVNKSGFIPPSIFLVCCSVVPLILTIFLKPRDTSKNKASGQKEIEEEKQHLNQSEAEIDKSSSNASEITVQLREVFRIYTTNAVKCAICDPKSKTYRDCA